MSSEESRESIVEEQELTRQESWHREGTSWRAEVTWEDRRGLLYVWDRDDMAARMQSACVEGLAGELFAVPDLIRTGPCWSLVEHPGGVSLSEHLEQCGVSLLTELSLEKAESIVSEIGTLMRKLHEIRTSGAFGAIDPGKGEPRWQTFNAYVAHRLEAYGEALNHGVPEQERTVLLEYLGDLRHELSSFYPRHPASLSHGDFGPEHVWVLPETGEVTGLTGFGFARFLPSEFDISCFLWMSGLTSQAALVRSFYSGYGAARTMDVQRRERFYRRMEAFEVLLGEKRALTRRERTFLLRMASPAVI